jgi:hypothetical protein
MLATLSIHDSSVACQEAVVGAPVRGCGSMERLADAPPARLPLSGEMSGRCLDSGCAIAALVKAAEHARKTHACRMS